MIESCAFSTPFISNDVGSVKELIVYSKKSHIINDNKSSLVEAMKYFVENKIEEDCINQIEEEKFNSSFGRTNLQTRYAQKLIGQKNG
jgi:hypothetical protein